MKNNKWKKRMIKNIVTLKIGGENGRTHDDDGNDNVDENEAKIKSIVLSKILSLYCLLFSYFTLFQTLALSLRCSFNLCFKKIDPIRK